MACWKWFDGVLKEAGVKISDKNKAKVEDIIHRYVGKQASYGNCSADWSKAAKQINSDPKMRNELIGQLKVLV